MGFSIKHAVSVILQTATKHAVHSDCGMPILQMFISKSEPYACVQLEAVEHLAIDLQFGTSFIDCSIWPTFQSEGNVVTCVSHQMSVLSSFRSLKWLFSGTAIPKIKPAPNAELDEVDHGEEKEKFHLFKCLVNSK